MQHSMSDITGITVCSNTVSLIERALTSVRQFHPDMNIIVVDGSTMNDPCQVYVRGLRDEHTHPIICGHNIGHGRGMDLAMHKVQTKYALIFDSDIIMHKSPVEAMLAMMEDDTYGVGYIEPTGEDGFEYGAKSEHKGTRPVRYLHPYFMLIQVSEYFKWPPYVHHGAPCYMTMTAIHRAGMSEKILKEFPGLGHTAGKGWNWKGEPREYIQHDTRGTRDERVRHRKPEIEAGWVYENRPDRTGMFRKRVR